MSYGFSAAVNGTDAVPIDIDNTEKYIDYLNKEISKYISGIMVHETNLEETSQLSAYFKIAGNLERIGDHVLNIGEALVKIIKGRAKKPVFYF